MFGAYRVLHQAGIGVLGPVFRAQGRSRDQVVAIKAFKLDVAPEQAPAIADALRALVADAPRVPGLVPLVGAGLESSTPWLAMDVVSLPTLDTRLRDGARLPLDEALVLIQRLAETLDTFHARGLRHGSLHPRDIFVGEGGTVLVSGVGVATAMAVAGLRPPARRPYSAPETLAGDRLEPPADRYSLGAVAYELVTGRRLLGTGDDVAARFDLGGESGDAERAATALAAMLAERPAHRPSSALAFAQALTLALRPGGLPMPVTPAPADGLGPGAAPEPGELEQFARQGTLWESSARRPFVETGEAPVELGESDGRRGDEPRDADTMATGVLGSSPVGLGPGDFSAGGPDPASPDPVESPPVGPGSIGANAGGSDAMGPDALRPIVFDDRAPDPLDQFGIEEAGTAADRLRPVAASARLPDPDPILRPRQAARVAPGLLESVPEAGPSVADDPVPHPVAMAGRMPGTLPEPESAGGSPPLVVLALTLALGLAVGGAGGYLLGQRSGERAAQRALGGETGLVPASDPTYTEGPSPTPPPVPDTAPGAAPDAPAATRPAPERPRDRAVVSSGQIVVRSAPAKAGVLVNGTWRGRTPLTLRSLALGTYTVRVVEDGYTAETRRVSIDARVPAATVSVQLARSTPPSTRPAVPATRPAATAGALFLESRPPGARVFIEGNFVGTTPLLISDLAPGAKPVRIEHPGRKAWSTTVTIVAGQRLRVAASLEEGS